LFFFSSRRRHTRFSRDWSSDVCSSDLGKVEEAAQSYEKVLTLDPGDAEALQAMDALYRRTGHWEELIGVFRRRIDLVEDAAQRRSEERRVGKERRTRRAPHHEKEREQQ